MDDSVFDHPTHPAAAAVWCRTSFLALGRAGVAAAVTAAMAVAAKAGTNIGKLGKRHREQCRASFVQRCQGSDDCLEALLPCCEPFADCFGAANIEWLYPI